jgi:hypothetical protein
MRQLTDEMRLNRIAFVKCQFGVVGRHHHPFRPAKTPKAKIYRTPDPYQSHLDLSCDPEDVIANRILSVLEYLRRIQEK